MNTLTLPAAAAATPDHTPEAAAAADPWAAKAATVADFVARAGRLPAPGPDLAEDEMAGWLAVQRRADQQRRIDPGHRAWLDRNIPSWRQSRQERWAAQLAALEAAKTARPTDRVLREWLKTQRRAAAGGTLSAERKVRLDSAAPGWDRPATDHDTAWQSRAEDLANFLDLTGSLPVSTKASAEGVSLYRWMSYQRSLAQAGALPKKRHKWLDKNVPGWLPEVHPGDARWQARAEELTTFIAIGRWPRVTVPAERQLARWLGTQRATARAGRMSNERRTALDNAVPGWLPEGRTR